MVRYHGSIQSIFPSIMAFVTSAQFVSVSSIILTIAVAASILVFIPWGKAHSIILLYATLLVLSQIIIYAGIIVIPKAWMITL